MSTCFPFRLAIVTRKRFPLAYMVSENENFLVAPFRNIRIELLMQENSLVFWNCLVHLGSPLLSRDLILHWLLRYKNEKEKNAKKTERTSGKEKIEFIGFKLCTTKFNPPEVTYAEFISGKIRWNDPLLSEFPDTSDIFQRKTLPSETRG